MKKAIMMVTSHLACWPLGYGAAEFLKANGNLKVAGWCLLASAVVAIIGAWTLYLTGENT